MIQEDVERRTIALAVKTTKLTARVLARVLAASARKLGETYQKSKTPHGKQTVAKLMNHGVSTEAIPLSGETKLFDRIARKHNVDYAFYKTGPQQYKLFFKAGQADAVKTCFEEYSKAVIARANRKRPLIRDMLKHFSERVREQPRQLERAKEVNRDER